MPESLSLSLGWPLDEKTQDELDSKKRKPSKEIKVDAAREAVTFTQFTRSRGTTKVVLVYPAERMNTVTANTLLKTLEEPPGAVKFILATEAAHQLLPTIRSRCQGHTMHWPVFEQALVWLTSQAGPEGKAGKLPETADLQTLLAASGGRPADALARAQTGPSNAVAKHWQAFPKAMARGEVGALTDWTPAQAVDALQKLCHDMLATRAGAKPRFFGPQDLPVLAPRPGQPEGGPGFAALGAWAKELAATARTVEHPYNPGLMLEALASRAQLALRAR